MVTTPSTVRGIPSLVDKGDSTELNWETLPMEFNDMDSELGVKTPINYDELQLQAQGHHQDMPRRFSLWSMFAIAFTITSSWVGFSTSVGISLLYGGSAAVVYGQIVGALSCAIITLGLAELASAYPSSGGTVLSDYAN